MGKYVNLEDVINEIRTKDWIKQYDQICIETDIIPCLFKLPTKEIPENEFKVGDEIWFIHNDGKVYKDKIVEKEKTITEFSDRTDVDIMYCMDMTYLPETLIFKTKEEAEHALLELNKK